MPSVAASGSTAIEPVSSTTLNGTEPLGEETVFQFVSHSPSSFFSRSLRCFFAEYARHVRSEYGALAVSTSVSAVPSISIVPSVRCDSSMGIGSLRHTDIARRSPFTENRGESLVL